MDLRQNKRYRLKASVMFCWEKSDGSSIRCEGYSRDISAGGVFVLTADRLPSGTAVQLEITLPSLREKQPGAFLRSRGHVVRSEETGFAAAAEIGFRMRVPEALSDDRSLSSGRGNGKSDVSAEDSRQEMVARRLAPQSRFWM